MKLAKQPIKRRKIYEEIVDRIEDMMLRGELRPGDVMPSERELMETFDVGRPSVREALFALEKMGLIGIRNGERAYVTRPSSKKLIHEVSTTVRHLLIAPEGLREFQRARETLECALARAAAKDRTEDDLERIRAALERNRQSVGDVEQFAESDVEFHYAIIAVSRNGIFNELHSAVFAWLHDQRTTSLRHPGSDEEAYRAHAAICEAIVRRDPDAAEDALRRHLRQVNTNYWTAIEALDRN